MSTPGSDDGPAIGVKRFSHGSRVPGWDEAADLDKDPAIIPDPATTPVPPELRAEIEARMALYPDRRSAAIPALAAAQREYGYCSPEAIEQVACVMGLTPGYLVAVASFYDMLETEPKPAHDVYVCTNISCSLRGADAIHEAMVKAAHGHRDFNVRSFECLGACDIAPMASVDGVYVGPLEPGDPEQIVADVSAGRPVLEAKQLARRAVADPHANRQEFTPPEPEPAIAREGAAHDHPHVEDAIAGPAGGGAQGGAQPASDHGEQHDLDPPDRHQGA